MQSDLDMAGEESARTKPSEENIKYSEKWVLSKLQQHILQEWYKGGRNEARRVGCFGESVSCFDMTSAYPTALAALRPDYDFINPIIRTRNDGAANSSAAGNFVAQEKLFSHSLPILYSFSHFFPKLLPTD